MLVHYSTLLKRNYYCMFLLLLLYDTAFNSLLYQLEPAVLYKNFIASRV